jgi:hypothetical protein
VAQRNIRKNQGREPLRKADVWGPFVAELQDVVDATVFIRDVTVSFETNEQGLLKVYMPFACTIVRVRLQVQKALAATDAGTVQLKDAAGTNMTGGLGSLAASSPIGTEATITPTALNTVAAGSFFSMTTAKTTAGGKVVATVEYTMTTPAPQQP